MQITSGKFKGMAKFARPIALALCVVLSLSASAKADSLAYLNAMLNDPNPPDVLVDPYSFSQTGMSVSITGPFDITAPDQTAITIDDGADTGGPYMGIFSASITLDAGNNATGGTLTQSVDLTGLGTQTTMFSSSDLLPLAFGAVTGHAGVSYWFAFTQDTSTFYAPAGTVIGGLLTTEGDLKEFAFPVPLPGAAQGGLALLLGLVICTRFRRGQSSLTPLS